MILSQGFLAKKMKMIQNGGRMTHFKSENELRNNGFSKVGNEKDLSKTWLS